MRFETKVMELDTLLCLQAWSCTQEMLGFLWRSWRLETSQIRLLELVASLAIMSLRRQEIITRTTDILSDIGFRINK